MSNDEIGTIFRFSLHKENLKRTSRSFDKTFLYSMLSWLSSLIEDRRILGFIYWNEAGVFRIDRMVFDISTPSYSFQSNGPSISCTLDRRRTEYGSTVCDDPKSILRGVTRRSFEIERELTFWFRRRRRFGRRERIKESKCGCLWTRVCLISFLLPSLVLCPRVERIRFVRHSVTHRGGGY